MRMVYDKLFDTMKSQDKDIRFLVNIVKLPPVVTVKLQVGENVDIKYLQQISNCLDCTLEDIFEYTDEEAVNFINSKHEHSNDKIPVYMCNKHGNILRRFGSIKEAARFLRKEPSAIRQCINGNRKTAYGYTWKRAD